MRPPNIPLLICSCLVIFAHAVLMIYFSFTSPLLLPPKTKLAVSTIRLVKEQPPKLTPVVKEKNDKKTLSPKEEKTETLVISQPPPPKQISKKKESAQKPKTEAKQTSSKKQNKPTSNKPSKKPNPPPKKGPSSDKKVTHKKELIAQAQASLNKIQSNPTNESLSDFVNTPSQPIQSFSATISCQSEDVSPIELSYREELANRLQLLLRLPELGEINVKLTIQKNGTIKRLEILSSESLLNRKYVEKTLLQHTMPSLGKQFGNIEDYTFTITMRGS